MADQSLLIYQFIEHYDTFAKIALRIVKNRDAALDVLQNVALTLAQKRLPLDGIESPNAFLAVCVRHAAMNYLRRESRSSPSDPEALNNLPAPIPKSEYDAVDWTVTIEKYLEDYTPEMRKAFILHYVDGWPQTEIAARLRMRPEALRQQFYRMRKKIAARCKHLSLLIVFLQCL